MAKTIVIFPGGFHPFHKGHFSVYQNLVDKFPQADVYVASSPSTTERPFPFGKKKILATAAGVPSDKFVQVKSPYKSEEITSNYDANSDHLIFALSQKDVERISFKHKKDGSPSYFQKWKPGLKLEPFAKHGYIYIAPVKPFEILGKEITSASAIRKMYSDADDAGKLEIVKELYPKGDAKKIKSIFDGVLTEEGDWNWFFEHIVKTKKGYILYSKSKPRKKLGGPYPSKEQAIKRERQVQYFKHAGEEAVPNKTFTKLSEDLEKACWKGYEAIGTKKKGGKVVPNCVPVEEDADGEGGMILSQLKSIHDQVCELMDHIKPEDNFEGWVQSKMTLARDYVQSVYGYLMYNPDAKEEGDLEEVGSTEDIGEEDQETLPLSAADVAAADDRLSKIIKDKSNEKVVNKLLSALKPRHKQVIELRFGLNGKEPHTLEEIGKIFDLTSQRIRTIEAYALRNMRRAAAKLPELQKAGTNKKVFAYQTEEDHVTHLDPSKGQQILLEGHPIPDKVKETAQQGIELRKEYRRGGTPAAIQMAKDLVTKDELSMPKVKAMKAYFFRNKTQVQQGESGHRPSSNTIPSDEWIAWQLYGGNPGRDWVEGILNPKKQADSEINTDEEDQ